MKKWRQYPVTIRAAIISSIIAIIGMAIIEGVKYVYKSNNRQRISVQNPISHGLDSLIIVRKVKDYYKYDSINIKRIIWCDLDNNGIENEFLIVYQLNQEQYTAFYDIFILRNSNIYNIYHDEYMYDHRSYEIYKQNNKSYLLKMWNSGTGSYMSFEVYKLDEQSRLNKIYILNPEHYDNLQGHYCKIDDIIYLILADKRYQLSIKNDNVTLIPYTTRLNSHDLQNSEHVLRFDKKNKILQIYFDNKLIEFNPLESDYIDSGFEEILGKSANTYFQKDTIRLSLNDICWIDDNTNVPLGLRYFQNPHFEFSFGLFDNIIAKKTGSFSFDFSEGYGDTFVLNFKIAENKESYE